MTDRSTATSGYPDPWPAPEPFKSLHATVAVPGSKSLSNRYLVLAALGRRPVVIKGLLRSRDTELMIGALRELGVQVEDGAGTTRVTPPASGVFSGGVQIGCGLAGTVMRFVPPLTLLAAAPVHFDGDPQAYRRPMKPLLDGLRQLGAQLEFEGEPGFLPFTVVPPERALGAVGHSSEDTRIGDGTVPGRRLSEVSIDSSGSSQFISGLLLTAPRLPQGLKLRHVGGELPSLPHIRMTVVDLKAAGVHVEADEAARTWTVSPGAPQLPGQVTVEPDLSNAAPFLGAALIAGGRISVPRWPHATTQPGGLLPGLFRRLGARVRFDAGGTGSDVNPAGSSAASGTLTVASTGVIHGLGDVDLSAAGEIVPSLAAVLLFADAPSRLHGIAHLRGHETNRLAALVTEITRVGGAARELPDGIEITPVPSSRFHPAVMETYADHRMATFAAMLGLRIPGIAVRNISTTTKTLPDFVGLWNTMINGGNAEMPNRESRVEI